MCSGEYFLNTNLKFYDFQFLTKQAIFLSEPEMVSWACPAYLWIVDLNVLRYTRVYFY